MSLLLKCLHDRLIVCACSGVLSSDSLSLYKSKSHPAGRKFCGESQNWEKTYVFNIRRQVQCTETHGRTDSPPNIIQSSVLKPHKALHHGIFKLRNFGDRTTGNYRRAYSLSRQCDTRALDLWTLGDMFSKADIFSETNRSQRVSLQFPYLYTSGILLKSLRPAGFLGRYYSTDSPLLAQKGQGIWAWCVRRICQSWWWRGRIWLHKLFALPRRQYNRRSSASSALTRYL